MKKTSKTIAKFKLRLCVNFEFYDFLSTVISTAKEYLTDGKFDEKIAVLELALDDYGKALRQEKRFVDAQELRGINKKMMNLYRGMTLTVNGLMFHPDEAKRSVAERARLILDLSGSMSTKAVRHRFIMAEQILKELAKLSDADRQLIGLDEWLVPLVGSMNDYFVFRDEASRLKSNYRKGWVRNSRVHAEEVYTDFANTVNAFIVLAGDDTYSMFVNIINTVIKSIKAAAKGKKTRRGHEST